METKVVKQDDGENYLDITVYPEGKDIVIDNGQQGGFCGIVVADFARRELALAICPELENEIQPLKFPTKDEIKKFKNEYYGCKTQEQLERGVDFQLGVSWAIDQMKGESK